MYVSSHPEIAQAHRMTIFSFERGITDKMVHGLIDEEECNAKDCESNT